MMQIRPIPIFQDNYIWVIENQSILIAVDPGDGLPLIEYVRASGKKLAAILITHHHADHVGGLPALLDFCECSVFGPAGIQYVQHVVGEGDRVRIGGLEFAVWAVPGHTLDHIAYVCEGAVFCGDTLFACGCGRLIEGTPEQMQHSLGRLLSLPMQTRLYCTHEYTLANQRFALGIEPDNAKLFERNAQDKILRAQNLPTIPTTVGLERETNPFLRWDNPQVQSVALQAGAYSRVPVDVFAAIRRLKDQFQG